VKAATGSNLESGFSLTSAGRGFFRLTFSVLGEVADTEFKRHKPIAAVPANPPASDGSVLKPFRVTDRAVSTAASPASHSRKSLFAAGHRMGLLGGMSAAVILRLVRGGASPRTV
jgi:hypothetical protein